MARRSHGTLPSNPHTRQPWLPAAGTCGSPENFLVSGAHAAHIHRQAPRSTILGQWPTGYHALGCSALSPTVSGENGHWLPNSNNLQPVLLSSFSLLSHFSGKWLLPGSPFHVITCPHPSSSLPPGWLLQQHWVKARHYSEGLCSSPRRGKEGRRKPVGGEESHGEEGTEKRVFNQEREVKPDSWENTDCPR